MQHFAAPANGLFFEIGNRYHGIHQAHIQRFLSVVLTAQEPDFAGFFLPDDACHIRGAPAAVEGAYFRTGLAEDGVLGGNGQIAHHVQHVTAADGVARHHRHHRFWTGADLTLEIEDVQVVGTRIVLVSAVVAAHFLIAAGAERFIAFAGQDNHADVVVVARIRQGLNHLFHGQRTEGVTHLRTVDGDFGNAVGGFVVTNVGVAFGAVLPFNRGVKHVFIRIDHRVSFIR